MKSSVIGGAFAAGLTLFVCVSGGAAYGQETTTPPKDATADEVGGMKKKQVEEEVVVRGSRIRRKDLTTPAPVEVINRQPPPVLGWSGFYVGGSVGARGTNNNVTNQNQITFLVPDPRPDPTASSSNSAFIGRAILGFEKTFLDGAGPGFVIGAEAFLGTGNNSSTIRGIPGTGGIATPAVMANDSTTVKETWDAGILGRIGTIVPIGNSPVFLSLLGGIGFLKVDLDANCTAAGACGTNGIPAQTLSASKTLTGTLIGFEVGMPLATVLASSPPAENPVARVLRTANIRAQFLHGDFGHVTAPVGNQAQIQIMFDQKVTTNNFTIGLFVPIPPP